MRVLRPDTGELAAAAAVSGPNYRVQVSPGLYLLIADLVDLKSGKAFLGFSRALRVKAEARRRLDVSLQPLPKTRASARTLAGAAQEQLRAQRKLAVVKIGEFEVQAGPASGVEDLRFDLDSGLSAALLTELFQRTRDKLAFFGGDDPGFKRAIKRELQLQRKGVISPETRFKYRPLRPKYRVDGRASVERIDGVAGTGDLSIELKLIDIRSGRTLARRTAAGKGIAPRDLLADLAGEFAPELLDAIAGKETPPPTVTTPTATAPTTTAPTTTAPTTTAPTTTAPPAPTAASGTLQERITEPVPSAITFKSSGDGTFSLKIAADRTVQGTGEIRRTYAITGPCPTIERSDSATLTVSGTATTSTSLDLTFKQAGGGSTSFTCGSVTGFVLSPALRFDGLKVTLALSAGAKFEDLNNKPCNTGGSCVIRVVIEQVS